MRQIFVPEDVHDRMVRNGVSEGFPSVNLDKLTATFCAGYFLLVSLTGDPEGKHPDFERLVEVDEVWAMCFRSEKSNQWRLLGRFLQRNAFVGLKLHRRSELAFGRYTPCANDMIFDWDQRFPTQPPLRGSSRLHYFSGPTKDVYADL